MATVHQELGTLRGPLSGALVCDWSRTHAPGIGPVWELLNRLAELGAGGEGLRITHLGGPRTLEFLQKLKVDRYALRAGRSGYRV